MTEDEQVRPLRMHQALATAEDPHECGYVAILSIEGGVKTITRIEAQKLRDWLNEVLVRTNT